MQDVASDTSSTTAPLSFDWSNATPSPELSLEVRVPWRVYQWFKAWGLPEVKRTWPCGSTGYKKEDQSQLLRAILRFYKQPFRMDEDSVIVKEVYRPPKSGFAGRLNSHGCQGLVRAIRSNILIDTCDIDMNNAQPRCVVWICSEFSIATPMFEHYIRTRDGQDGMLRRIIDEEGVSKDKAKKLVIITLMKGDNLRGLKGQYVKKLDAEAKEIQQALMARPELQWILGYCKDQNRAGSFMSYLYHFVESKLLSRVHGMVVDEFDVAVAALVFDGLNLATKSLHGNQQILERASAVCEEVCPGIRMQWAWKQLDFVLVSNDKKPLTGADGSVKELRVPDDYRPPPLPLPPAAGSDADPARLVLDPETQPTYEELRVEFSSNLGGGGFEGGWHGKVGSEFIRVDEDDKLELFDSSHFKTKYLDLKYFEIRYMDDPETGERVGEIQSSPFISRWMQDERMRARYINDRSQRYCWERFDMFPVRSECPDEVYNIWSGLAAEKMESEYSDTTRAGLLLILEHFKMLFSGNVAQYTFALNILAHAVQYPNVKLGIMLCLVGKQGCGKGYVWELIERMIGKCSCFTTPKPERDVWGDNNSKMKDAFFVRITEVDKKKFTGFVGEMRTLITDPTIRVRTLYCTATNVKNYTRFFLDTNYVDSIPDEHGERRFFIAKCCEDKIGDTEYFQKLGGVIADDSVVRAFYDLLHARKIKSRYLGKDIPIGEYQKELKDSRRSTTELFIEHFVLDQDLNLREITLSVDEVCDKFKKWQEVGGEFERSKSSILKELALKRFPGIRRIKPRELVCVDLETNEVVEKQVSKYIFDLDALRRLYEIGDHAPVHEERGEGEAVDCEADVARWKEECESHVRLIGGKRAREEDDDEKETELELDAAVEGEGDDDLASGQVK